MSRYGRQQHIRGLPSLNEAKAARARVAVTGKVRLRWMRPVFWLWTGLILAAFGVIYWRIAAGQLQSQKSGVAAKQRAVRKTLGPKLLPFVEQVENWAMELARGSAAEAIAQEVEWEALAKKPGVYLRLLASKAETPASIRRAAAISLNDGFTSCFFIREGAPDPTLGPKCETSASCEPGLLCNEWDVCSVVPRPYNMRLAYRAWRILSDDFTRQLQDSTDDLQVRLLDRELDQVTKVDVPVAIEVLQRAKTVTVVLDESPEGALGVGTHPGEPPLTEEQRVQGLPHYARVGIWDVGSQRQLVRWRGQAHSRIVTLGRVQPVLEPEVDAARTRQANSCVLATALKGSILRRAASGHDAAASTAASSDPARPASAAGAGGK